MPYSIQTKDGLIIPDVPDNIDPSSDEARALVAAFRAKNQPADTRGEGGIENAVAQGLTFGWGDELGAAGAAAIGTLLPESMGGFPGDASMDNWRNAYTDIQGQIEGATNRYAEENPKKALAGEVLGAIGTGGVSLAKLLPKARSIVAKGGVGTAVGTGEGALYGAGSAGPGNRSAGAVEGGMMGAATGGVLGAATGVGQRLVDRATDRREIGRMLQQGVPDERTAGYQLKNPVPAQQGTPSSAKALPAPAGSTPAALPKPKITSNKLSQETIRQGWDKGLIASVQAANPRTKRVMNQMLAEKKKGMTNREYQVRNRPEKVMGQALADRVKTVVKANQKAANRLDEVADGLKEFRVDVSTPVDSFLKNLSSKGINVDFPAGGVKINFKGSEIEGIKPAQKVVKTIIKRMYDTDVNSAFDVHRLKKFIDSQVKYGESKSGYTGQLEGMTKKLRAEINGLLREASPEYGKVNQAYSETRKVMDEVGKLGKVDIDSAYYDNALGQEMRKLMSNYGSRNSLMENLDELETMANKYAKKPFKENIDALALFSNQLDRRFGSSADTSLAGRGQEVMEAAVGGKAGILAAGLRKGAEKAGEIAGRTDENAIKAMQDLLRDN